MFGLKTWRFVRRARRELRFYRDFVKQQNITIQCLTMRIEELQEELKSALESEQGLIDELDDLRQWGETSRLERELDTLKAQMIEVGMNPNHRYSVGDVLALKACIEAARLNT
jgi:FtsZ-binding cell division protein ZapB